MLPVAVPDINEGVGHPEVRVLPQSEHGEELVRRSVKVEVVAVVEVTIAGRRVGDQIAGLVDGVVVPR